MADPLIELRGLSKRYRVGGTVVHALQEVDLAIHRGECLAIVGESGSGKTTLGHLLLGVEAPSDGVIRFEGAPMPVVRPRRLRRCLQLVQQNPMSSLNPKRSVYQSVALPLAVHRVVPRARRRHRVVELLEAVGLSADYMARYPNALSGGERQRVALARALACEPDCIVLDEPTSALDVSVQARVLQLFASLQRRFKLTYVFITHDLGVVRNLADRVSVFYRGRIVETGPTPDLFARPKHRYTQMLMSSIPVVTAEEARTKPDWPWEQETAAAERGAEVGCPFSPRCPYALDICLNLRPALEETTPGHKAACHNPA